MEIIPVDTTYRIRLGPDDDETVEMKAYIWPYFRTLHDMVTDCDINTNVCVIEVPLHKPVDMELTVPLLQLMIDFYVVFYGGIEETLSDESVSKSFYDRWTLALTQEATMVKIAKAADFLNASELLVFILDQLTSELRQKSTQDLLTQAKVKSLRKSVRIQYAREELITRILEILLSNADIARVIDTRIRKYPNRITVSRGDLNHSIIIRQGKDLFLHDNVAASLSFIAGRMLPLAHGRQALYREEINEVVMGLGFYAILNEERLLLYGGVYDRTFDGAIDGISENVSVVGVWTGRNYLFILTNAALLLIHGDGEPISIEIEDIDHSTILDISVGNNHALILTSDGLYGWQASKRGSPLGKTTVGEPEIKKAIKLDVHGTEIKLILCRGYHSMVVTTTDKIFVVGGVEDELNAMGIAYLTGEWVETLYSPPNIRMIEGDDHRTVVVTKDQELYVTGSRDVSIFGGSAPLPTFTKLERFFVGRVISVTSMTDDALLIGNTNGLYVLYAQPHTLNFLGGTQYENRPKLNIPFAAIEEEEGLGASSSKSKRDLSCHICYARASFIDSIETHPLCSRYCLHKTIIQK